MRILIADDDPVARTILAKIFAAHAEHTTTLAGDGAAAWALLDDPGRSFDVLFLDLSMPKMDGFELLKRIRDNRMLLKSLEVVLCTSSNDRESVIKAAKLGARHYIVKPCTEAIVMAKLRQFQPA